MIEVTVVQLAQNPDHIQKLAQKEPVLVADGDTKQVLMDYEQYKQLAHVDEQPETAYEFLERMMSRFSAEELEILANDDTNYDMSE